jgi:hypothetical protein
MAISLFPRVRLVSAMPFWQLVPFGYEARACFSEPINLFMFEPGGECFSHRPLIGSGEAAHAAVVAESCSNGTRTGASGRTQDSPQKRIVVAQWCLLAAWGNI